MAIAPPKQSRSQDGVSGTSKASAVFAGGRNGAGTSEDRGPMNASEHIDQLIAGISDWRGKTLASLRKSILGADKEIAEEWKWMEARCGLAMASSRSGNAHKDKVKLTFSHGASLPDPENLFNNGFGGKVWRAIDVF
ncbi:DUF1801 domain-containing protein [Ensifer canadensis]